MSINKLPIFPGSKPLKIEDKPVIEGCTRQHPPFSDFNFTSMFSWDSGNEYRVARHNDNLVVRFSDYTTNDFFYSCLGNKKIDSTLHVLLGQSDLEDITPQLRLIPEVVANNISRDDTFRVKEDETNFDYIYSLPASVMLKGQKYQNQRTRIRKFENAFKGSIETKVLDLSDFATQQKVIDLFHVWANNTRQPPEDTESELKAITKSLQYSSSLDIFCLGIYVKGSLVAFSINEIVDENYGITHFEKADTNLPGSFNFIRHKTNSSLLKQGCQLVNLEQDLGIASLRTSKKEHRPIDYLKKYTIEFA